MKSSSRALSLLRTFDSPYLADWFAISLRWLCLLGVGVSTALERTMSLGLLSVMLAGVVWNLMLTLLTVFNRRLLFHRFANTGFDMLLSGLLFMISGGLTGSELWMSLLAIGSAAIYFEVRGSLIMAAILSLLQVAWTLWMVDSAANPDSLKVLVGFNLLAGVVVGGLSILLMRRLRALYHNLIHQREEVKRLAREDEHKRMRRLFQLIETLSGTLNYRTVLEIGLDMSTAAVGEGQGNTDLMISAVLLFSERDLKVLAARRLTSHDLQVTFPAESGILAEALKTGEAKLFSSPMNDPELRRIIALQNCSAALCLPLLRGLEAYGVMIFAHPEAGFFTRLRAEVLEMLSHQMVIALQNARLYQALSEEKERIVNLQEEAQKKLARDLHDGPTQSIASIAMRLNIARKLMERSPKEALHELEGIEELARRTTQEIRHMLFTLRPLALESEGLLAALNTMADKMKDTYQQSVRIDANPLVVERLDPTRQAVVFYLAEEAVTNARKHAKAAEILVRLRFAPNDPEVALLEVLDNGSGFNVDQVMGDYDRRGSLGMVNLRERTDQVNGILNIDSIPGKGTRVQVFVPLNQEAADRLQRGK